MTKLRLTMVTGVRNGMGGDPRAVGRQAGRADSRYYDPPRRPVKDRLAGLVRVNLYPLASRDKNLEINPYSPAVPVAADSHPPRPIVEPIHFDGLVHRSDVMALGRNDRGTRIAKVLLFFSAIVFANLAIMLVPLSFIVFPFLIIVPLWILSLMQGGNYAKRILRISPRIIGPLRGKIDNEMLELRYLHYHSITPIDSLTGVRLSSDAIGFTVDARKLFISVLPKHLFHADDFERVTARLEQLAIERPLIAAMTMEEDQRLVTGQTLTLLQQPEGGIAFSGTLLRTDLSSTPVFKRQIRKFFVANLILLSLAILIPVLIYLVVSDVDWLVGLVVFIVLFSLPLLLTLAHRLIAYYRYRRISNAEITKLSGWVAKDNVTLNSTIGSFAYLKNAFTMVESDDQSIQCLLSGQMSQVVLLPRRFFQSNADFEAARSVLQAGSGL